MNEAGTNLTVKNAGSYIVRVSWPLILRRLTPGSMNGSEAHPPQWFKAKDCVISSPNRYGILPQQYGTDRMGYKCKGNKLNPRSEHGILTGRSLATVPVTRVVRRSWILLKYSG
jgi:hypothetical protein